MLQTDLGEFKSYIIIKFMMQIIQRIPLLAELFINGCFILLYSLTKSNKLPVTWPPETVELILSSWVWVVPIVLFLVVIANYMNSGSFEEFLRKYIFSIVVFIPMLITWGDIEFAFWLASVHLLSSILSLYEGKDKDQNDSVNQFKLSRNVLANIKLQPAQLVLLSFVGAILLGTFLLMLPVSSPTGKSVKFIDGLFMATSATCVTGLGTISLAQDLSLFGQIVMLSLIQIGGLSIMTLYASMSILLGKSMGMKDRIIIQDVLDVSGPEELFGTLISIIKYTFIIEFWGGVILSLAFTLDGFEFGQALYYGFYHSVSAFCNAGFSLFDNNLESYATKPSIHGPVIVLITLGGLGFSVLKELREMVFEHRKVSRLSLHTKTVLVTSFVLTTSGALFIFFGEFLNALDPYSLWGKVQVALFQSVTLRTAGYDTIPMTSLQGYTLFAMTMFMFVGGSPGSTAGGIKTTSLAILIESVMSTLKGEKSVSILDRKIPNQIVVRTIALAFFSIMVASFFTLVMVKLEPQQEFLPLYFEVMSALGTVGLSVGVTSSLSWAGKFVVSLVMLIGRIGPLTLILAIAQRNRSTGKIDYPVGRIMIG